MLIMYSMVIPLLLIILAGSLDARVTDRGHHKSGNGTRRQDRNRHQQAQLHHGNQPLFFHQSRQDNDDRDKHVEFAKEDKERHSELTKGKSKFDFNGTFSSICILSTVNLDAEVRCFQAKPCTVHHFC